jgi:hypothetical protein
VTLSSRITITVMPAPPAVTQLAGQNVPQGIANSFEKFKEESGGRALLKLEHPSASRNDIPTYTASEIL